MPAAEVANSDDGSRDDAPSDVVGLEDLGDAVDMATFNQILEMDEPGECEFSQSIVEGFFEQAEETITSMKEELENKELEKLSSLGHFLKGSSATLGLVKVRDNCEKIQRFGKKEKEDGSPLPDEKVCLEKIGETLKTLETDYADVEQVLKQYFEGRAATD
ncbi:hypothetical protein D7B24_005670 [Verticillium nonalfalfae]|uniref:HPt domain-containing protein n=3 Tax=Verticillium TaxID=1036719 RepID=A0A0G4KGS9_VERLO|nr:uncharacterized protein D7B24_005670 [Verticillium nonalfalfae]RNJ57729.1 hypothetical protein D7B24_005670 [Verticillium nonalfalfae]CRJ95419.1 hypothetical protein BN1708_002020 [Verticillium longisporum]